MASEDKTLRVVNDSANRQTLLYGMGDQHLDIIVSKLKERYKVDIELPNQRLLSVKLSARILMWKVNIRNSPVDTDSMVTLRCVLSHPVIWKLHMYLNRLLLVVLYRRTTSRQLKKVCRNAFRKDLWLLSCSWCQSYTLRWFLSSGRLL